MPKLILSGAAFQAAPGETVLDTLLRHGIPVANSCRAGACQSCLLRAASGHIPDAARRGLKPTLAAQGYFLSCVCVPQADLDLEPVGGLDIEAAIHSLERLTPTVLRARLKPAQPFDYRPGQYVTLHRPDGLARSYSLASHPSDGTLELHIRRAPQGRMSGWLFEEARASDPIRLRGPAGDCFYTPGNPAQPLLLAGAGTGLAPLSGICRDALRHGHTGPIHLYHGALRPEGLYLQHELNEIAARHSNVQYTPVVLEGGEAAGIATGALDRLILAAHPRLAGWRGYLCGDPALVNTLRKKLFLAGMASRDIFADAFLEAPAA